MYKIQVLKKIIHYVLYKLREILKAGYWIFFFIKTFVSFFGRGDLILIPRQ